VRALKAFVDSVLSGDVEEGQRLPLPAFPEPTRPRKAAAVSLEEYTHATLPLKCYATGAPLCVFALLPFKAGGGCPPPVALLARRHANDPVSFGCVGARMQDAFLEAFGLDESALPTLVALKAAGKRPRFARHDGPLEAGAMGAFVDTILGGGASFQRLRLGSGGELPELEPPYLLDRAVQFYERGFSFFSR